MNKNNIRECFFTLSGYMACSFQFIKAKYKIILTVFFVNAVCITIPLFLFGNSYSQMLSDFASSDIDASISIILNCIIVLNIYLILFLFLQAFVKGIIYTQCRAYVDNYQFSFKESLAYVYKRLGAFVTASLSAALIYFGAFIVLMIYVMIAGLLSYASAGFSNDLFVIVFVLFVILGYLAFIVLVYFIALKLVFASQASFNYNYGGFNALRYSNALMKGFKGKIFGYMMLFAAVGFGIAFIFNIINIVIAFSNYPMDLSEIDMNPWVSLISSAVSLAAGVFSTVYFNFVFINIDSVKKKIPSAYVPLIHGAQDSFDQYCRSHDIKTNNILPNE